MTLFSGKLPKRLKYPLSTARTVALIKAAETSDAGLKHWSREEAAELTESLARESMPGTSPASFIEKRASIAFSKISEKSPSFLNLKTGFFLKAFLALSLILGAYVIGALAERFLASGAEINLFSPVFLFLFGWNALVYLFIILALLLSILRRRHTELPVRTTLARLYDGLFAPKLISSGIRSAFMSVWSPAVLRTAQFRISRILHWSAIAFAAGIVTSLIVRGMDASYTIGWSLPGLDNAPERVRDIFLALWGWIPDAANLSALPDADTVAAMRLDRITSETASLAQASDWLPRIFILIAVCVVIPRLLLIIWDTVAVWFLGRRAVLAADPYFENIILEAEKAVSESSAAPAGEEKPETVPEAEKKAEPEASAASEDVPAGKTEPDGTDRTAETAGEPSDVSADAAAASEKKDVPAENKPEDTALRS